LSVRTVKAGAVYFVLVFSVGFVLGVVRQLVMVPRLGEMWAELFEMPFMLMAIVVAARWTVRRHAIPPAFGARAAMGLIALSLLLLAEIGVVLQVRGLSLTEYIASREPVSGAVYLGMLGVYATLPALLGRGAAAKRFTPI
jgi:hypothetical protein